MFKLKRPAPFTFLNRYVLYPYPTYVYIFCVHRQKEELEFRRSDLRKVQQRLLKSWRNVCITCIFGLTMGTLLNFCRFLYIILFCPITVFFLFLPDDPQKDPNVTGDPYKTLFVARLVSCMFQIYYFLYIL